MNANKPFEEPPIVDRQYPSTPMNPATQHESTITTHLASQNNARGKRNGIPLIANLAWLIVPTFILITAFVLSVGDNRRVIVPIVQIAVPETCAMYARFGLDCPGCGLTRSFIHLSHGDALAAWTLSPAAVVVFVFVALQIPLATIHLLGRRNQSQQWTPTTVRRLRQITRFNEWSLIAIIFILMAQWIWRLILGEL